MKRYSLTVSLAMAILVAFVMATRAEEPDPSTSSGQGPSGIFFEATRLSPDIEGTQPGQVTPHRAEFCTGGLCVTESSATIDAHTQPFTDTTRIWVETSGATEAFVVSFESAEGYGLGQCQIVPGSADRRWGWCEKDPLGEYEAVVAIVHAARGTTVSGIAVAWSQSWEPPPSEPVLDRSIYIPILRQ